MPQSHLNHIQSLQDFIQDLLSEHFLSKFEKWITAKFEIFEVDFKFLNRKYIKL